MDAAAVTMIPGRRKRQNSTTLRSRRGTTIAFSMFAHTDSAGRNSSSSILCRTAFSNLGSYIVRFIFNSCCIFPYPAYQQGPGPRILAAAGAFFDAEELSDLYMT